MIHPRLPRFVSRNYAAALILAFAVSQPSHVVRAQVVWNNSGGTTDFNTATNWTGNTLPGTGSIATFTGAAAVQPNVSANISVSGLNFSSAASTGYVLSASGGAALSLLSTSPSNGLAAITSANSSGTNEITSALVLGAAGGVGQYILQTGAGTLSLSGLISAAGSNPLAISTAGTVALSGANTYSGNTLIFGAGSVSVASLGNSGSAGNLGAGSTVQLGIASNTGNLLYTGAGETTNRTIDISGTTGGASITSSGSGALIFSGNLAASGAGDKTFTLSGTNTGANALQGTIVNSTSGATSVVKIGAGAWSLSGNNTYTGGTAINAGTLTLGSATGFGSTGTISFGGGTLQHGTGITTDLSARFSTAASQAYKIDTNGNSVTYASALTSSGGSLTKSGNGTLTLTGGSTYDGGTTLSHGTLTLGSNSALASTGNITVNETTGAATATLNLGNGFSQQIGALTFGGAGGGSGALNNFFLGTGSTLTLGGNVTYDASGGQGVAILSGGTIALGATRTFQIADGSATSDLIIGSPLSGAGAALVKTGAGNLGLSGSISTYDGGTIINQGTLTTGAGASRLPSGGNITINGTVAGTTTLLSLNSSESIGALTFGGGNATSTSTNNVNLTTANTLTLGGNVTYDATNNPLGATISGSLGSVALGASRTFVVGDSSNAATDLTVSTALTGTGFSLTKTGAGTLSLSGNNTYTGGTAINAGTLTLGSATGLGSAGTITFGGGTLQHGTGITTDLSARFSNAASQAYKIDTNGNSVTYASALTSSGGSLTKSGAGTLTLTGANTYDGGTTVNNGTLLLGANSSLPGGGNVTVNSTANGNATLQMGGTTAVSIGALTLGGTGGVSAANNVVINGSAILTLGGTVTYDATGNPLGSRIDSTGGTLALGGNRIIAVGNSTNAGATVDLAISTNITGAGQSLTKTGDGYLTLSGANTYDGGTIINGGALQLNATNALASGRDVTVNTTTAATTAQFVLAGGLTQTIGALTLGGSAATGSTTLNNVTIAAGSTLTLGGNVTYDTTGNQGASLISGPGALALGATRTVNVGDSTSTFSELTISAPITGTGFGLVKTGAGRLVVSGANTYDGGTTVNGGELYVNANDSLKSTGNILVNQWSGTATSALTIGVNVSQTIGSLTLGGAGGSATGTNNVFLFTGSTLTVGGTLTYDAANNPFGSTIWGSSVTPGTLALGASRTIAVGNSSAATDLTISTFVTGSGGLTKTGAGFLSMAGNASYTGGTIVNDGTLFIGANTGLPAGGDVTVNSTVVGSAILQMGGSTAATIGALTLGGTGGVAASNSVAINSTAVLTLGGTLTYNATGNPLESTINGTGTLALGGNRIVAVGNSTNAGAATDLSIAAAISGLPGQSLTKTGAGFLIFTGAAKAYDGGTIIEGGTLQLNGSNLLTTAGNLTLNNQISGTTAAFILAGGLNQTIGALTFGGTTTAVGNTSINNVTIATGSTLTLGGTVTYDATANIGTSNITGGTLNLGGNRTFDVGNSTSTGSDLIIGSVVSGTGNLTKTGVGVLKLSSANSYVGDTTINGGQIFVSASNNVLPTTSNILVSQTGAGNATLSVYGGETAFLNQTISSLTLGGAGSTTSSSNLVTIAGNSTLTLGGTLTYVATGNPLGSTVSGGTLALGGNRTFDIGNSATTTTELTVSSVISGGSLQVLTKTGAGALRLLGANTYTSGTLVSAGGLVVANTTGSGVGTGALTIQSGAYLRGSGIIGGATTIEAGGIFGTGLTSSTTGNLTFTNGLTLNDGAVFNFQLGSVASDKITLMGGVLTGASTLGSLTINLNSGGVGNSFTAGTYTLFDFSTGGTTTSSFDVSDFTLGTTVSGYTYNLAMNGAGNMLQLTATASAIPEPSTYAAIFGALALAGAAWHRRRVRVRAVTKN